MTKTCSVCKFWHGEATTYQRQWGECDRASRHGAMMESGDYANRNPTTHPDFGCVQWEKKRKT